MMASQQYFENNLEMLFPLVVKRNKVAKKRLPKPEFTRGSNSHPVTLADGTSGQVAHQLKGRIESSYWFYLQWPCGGWREFDVRSLYTEAEEANVVKRIGDFYFQTPGRGTDTLPLIAVLLTRFRFEEIKAVSPLWSNQL